MWSVGLVGLVWCCLPRYVKLEEKMKLLWDAEMRVNTVQFSALSLLLARSPDHLTVLHCLFSNKQVHVFDVCQALWHLTTSGNDDEIYNLVDKNDTSKCCMRKIFVYPAIYIITLRCVQAKRR